MNSNCDSLSIIFLGDTYFGESYQQNPKFNHGTNIIEERGHDKFFENVKELLFGSDLAIANLETSLSNGDDMPVSEIGSYYHFADTKNTPLYLAKYNIKAVTLANNHTMDLGHNSLVTTIEALGNYGISSFGAGLNGGDASKPFFKEFSIEGNSFKLYVIGCYWQRSFFEEKGYYALGSKPGVSMLDIAKTGEQIRRIKEFEPSAYVVVYPHWGSNYKAANDIQKSAARYLVDAGADLIIGHAAHTLQESEFYSGKWIFYNIGNFIFNTPGRYRSTGAKPYGLMIQLTVREAGKTIRLYPVFTDNKKSNYKIRFLDENELKDCLIALESENSAGKLFVSEKGSIEVR